MARKRLTGTIVKHSSDKTYKVRVTYTRRHPKYKKVITIRKNFLVHSEDEYNVGDVVVIEETRRISKNKHFKIIGKASKLNKVANA